MKGYPSDQELVRQTRAGDLRAFEIIVERYQEAVYRTVYRLLRNRQEAEDAAQEAFIKCYQHLSQYDETRPFPPWLYRIATNLTLSKLRRQKKYQFVPWDLFFNRVTTTADPRNQGFNLTSRNGVKMGNADPEAVWEEKEARSEITLALKKLKPLDQLVIILRYFEELSYEEIAVILQTNRNNVEVRLYRARQKLRAILGGGQTPGKKEKHGEVGVTVCSRAGK